MATSINKHEEIKTVDDLVYLAIAIKKSLPLPNGFINSIWVDLDTKEHIVGDLIDKGIKHVHKKVENNNIAYYSFSILGSDFKVFYKFR